MSFIPKSLMFISVANSAIQYILVRRPFQSRAGAIIHLLVEALNGATVPNQRFLVNIGDRPRRERLPFPWPVFGPARVDGFRDIAAPDFVYGGWHEVGILDFDRTCAEMEGAGTTSPETPLLGWYGNVSNIEARRKLLSIAVEHRDVMHAVDTGYWLKQGDKPGVTLPSLVEQTRSFRFLIDVEGQGYSGRLKLLLHSGRVVFIQERPWREWFFPALEPWKHYVPVARDLSDLLPNLEKVRSDDLLEQHIIDNSRQFAKEYLTRQKAIEVWQELLGAKRPEGRS